MKEKQKQINSGASYAKLPPRQHSGPGQQARPSSSSSSGRPLARQAASAPVSKVPQVRPRRPAQPVTSERHQQPPRSPQLRRLPLPPGQGLGAQAKPEAKRQRELRQSLRKMKRSELIDIIDEMQRPGASGPSPREVREEKGRLAYQASYRKAVRTMISSLLVVAATAVLISSLFFPVLEVTGHSMAPNLLAGDIVVILKNSEPQRGELCTFYYQNKLLIKRVIGLPGDEIYINEEGDVFLNGQLLTEPYVQDKALGEGELEFPYQVPENHYFVLGDHRADSIDSRHAVIGTISTEEMVGRLILRIWPLDRFSSLKGH